MKYTHTQHTLFYSFIGNPDKWSNNDANDNNNFNSYLLLSAYSASRHCNFLTHIIWSNSHIIQRGKHFNIPIYKVVN